MSERIFTPLNDNLFITLDPRESHVGEEIQIEIPEQYRKPHNWGTVHAAGHKTDIEVGDKVFVPDHLGTHLTLGDQDFIVIPASKCIAMIKAEAA